MKNDKTLRENIEWLIEAYKKELEEEKNKQQEEQDYMAIVNFENIIMELEFALGISKKGE